MIIHHGAVVEVVDTPDLKSVGSNPVGVQVPLALLPLSGYIHTLGGPNPCSRGIYARIHA